MANPTPETASQASLMWGRAASTPRHLPCLGAAEDHPSGVTGPSATSPMRTRAHMEAWATTTRWPTSGSTSPTRRAAATPRSTTASAGPSPRATPCSTWSPRRHPRATTRCCCSRLSTTRARRAGSPVGRGLRGRVRCRPGAAVRGPVPAGARCAAPCPGHPAREHERGRAVGDVGTSAHLGRRPARRAARAPRRRLQRRAQPALRPLPPRLRAWISAEVRGVVDVLPDAGPPSDDQGVEASVLGAVFRDGAVDGTVLGYVHPHGTWIDWRA
jgi:hypothetical protein